MVQRAAGRRSTSCSRTRPSTRSALQSAPAAATATLNQGRVFIALKPHNQRNASADQVISAAATELASGPGHHPLYAGRAGHHRRRAAVEDPVSVHLDRCGPRTSSITGPRYSSTSSRAFRELPTSPPTRRTPGRASISTVNRDVASSFGILPATDRQYARRRLWPAHRLDNLHLAQPVSRRAGGRSAFPVRARGAQQYLRELFERTAGAAQHADHQHDHGGAARDQPSGPCSRRPPSRST